MNRMTVRTLLLSIIIALLALSAAACGGGSDEAAPLDAGPLSLDVNIDAKTADQIRGRDDVVILDVREDWEYASGHIPGALLLPLGQIPQRLSEIPTDKTVVAVCRSGNRSNQATIFLRQQGFDNVHNMQGGMNAWAQAGYEMVK